jgi:isopentenyl-diphosphate Delta-isomerase
MIKRFLFNIGNIDKRQLGTLGDLMFLVDFDDKTIGKIDKHKAHQNKWINSPEGRPHRAFSVFLFNKNSELLLQQRSSKKITFPLHWTNSCCSHPVVYDNELGVVLESKQRTKFELGINIDHCSPDLINKIIYKAKADEYWGEYELDYLIFLQINDFKINLNSEEVQDCKWISKKSLNEFIKNTELVTPWFKKIVAETDFEHWWDLYITGNTDKIVSNKIINLIEA